MIPFYLQRLGLVMEPGNPLEDVLNPAGPDGQLYLQRASAEENFSLRHLLRTAVMGLMPGRSPEHRKV